MPRPVQELLQRTDELQRDFKRLLTGTPMFNTLLEFDSIFQRIKFKLQSIGAVVEPELVKKNEDDFPPITNFMGEDITVAKPLVLKDINPKEAEKQAFRFAVDKLYKELPSLNPHTVVQSYTLPEHILIIRGVAKKADIHDFETRPITVQFIEEIILGIAIKEEEKQIQDLVNQTQATTQEQPAVKVLSQEDINGDPELQKRKASPGDQLVTTNGKTKLQKA